MNHHVTIAVLYLVIGLTSFLMYDGKRGKSPEEGERRPVHSVSSFRYIYRFSQLAYVYALVLFFMGRFELTFSLFHNLATLYSGAWISVVGIVLFVGAKSVLGRNYSNCSQMLLPKDVVTDGIYRHIRHPIYTSNLFIIFGLFLATGDLLVLAIWMTMLVYYHRSARIEEGTLTQEFSSYRQYSERTGRFLPKLSRLMRTSSSREVA